jgi:hypothetical protein
VAIAKFSGLRRNLWAKTPDRRAVEAAATMEKVKRCAAFSNVAWKSTKHFSTATHSDGDG